MAKTSLGSNKWRLTGTETFGTAGWQFIYGSLGLTDDRITLTALPGAGGNSVGNIDLGLGGNDAVTLGKNGTWTINLKGVEFLYALPSTTNVIARIADADGGFTTDGSLKSITTGNGHDTITYVGSRLDATLAMGAGFDEVLFRGTTFANRDQFWTFIRREKGQLDAYNLYSGYSVRMVDANGSGYGAIEKISAKDYRNGDVDVYVPAVDLPSKTPADRGTFDNIDLRSYEWNGSSYVNQFNSDSFNLATFSGIRYTSENLWRGEATVYNRVGASDNKVLDYFSTPSSTVVTNASTVDIIGKSRNMTHDLIVSEQSSGKAVEGQLRLYSANVASGMYNDFNDVFLGTSDGDAGTAFAGNGSAGSDRVALYGFRGNDVLMGGDSSDYLFGGQSTYNKALMSPQLGNQITGGDGSDFFGVGATNSLGAIQSSYSQVKSGANNIVVMSKSGANVVFNFAPSTLVAGDVVTFANTGSPTAYVVKSVDVPRKTVTFTETVSVANGSLIYKAPMVNSTWTAADGGALYGSWTLGYATDVIMDWSQSQDTLQVLSNGVAVIGGLHNDAGLGDADTISLRHSSSPVAISDMGNDGPRATPYTSLGLTVSSKAGTSVVLSGALPASLEVGDVLTFANTGSPTQFLVTALNAGTRTVTFSTSTSSVGIGSTAYETYNEATQKPDALLSTDAMAARDAQSIKNEAGEDISVRNDGLIVVRGQEGNDVIYDSAGNDYLYGNQDSNVVHMDAGGSDRVYVDTRAGRYYVNGFINNDDKLYLDRGLIDAFGFDRFAASKNTGRTGAIADVRTGETYTNGQGYSQGIDFLYGVTYRSYLASAYGAQPYNNNESVSMDYAANVTTYVAGTVTIGVAIGLSFIPFVGPAIAAPLFVTGALLTAGKIYSDLGDTRLGSVEHLNAVYELPDAQAFNTNYVYLMDNQQGRAMGNSSLASGANANPSTWRFLDFFPNVYTYDGFTPVLELNPYGTWIGSAANTASDADNGICAYFVVYAGNESYVFLVISSDNLIENSEAFKIAEINGILNANDIVLYDNEADPYNQGKDEAVVLRDPTIERVRETSGGSALIPHEGLTMAGNVRVEGSIDDTLSSSAVIELYDLMEVDPATDDSLKVGQSTISAGSTSFTIADPRTLGQTVIQTDYQTSGPNAGQLNPQNVDNNYQYQDRIVFYTAKLLNPVSGGIVIETKSNAWKITAKGYDPTLVIDDGESLGLDGGYDTLELKSTSGHLNNAADIQIKNIEAIKGSSSTTAVLQASVVGTMLVDVVIADAGSNIDDGVYTLSIAGSGIGAMASATVSGGKVTDTAVLSPGFGYYAWDEAYTGPSDTSMPTTVTLPAPGIELYLQAQTEGFQITFSDSSDTLVGSQGNDSVLGGSGADSLNGFEGDDYFDFVSASQLNEAATVVGGLDTDRIRVVRGEAALTLADVDFTDVNTVEILDLSDNAGDMTVTLGTEAQAAGLQTILGANNSDTMAGTRNDDIDASAFTTALTMVGAQGDDSLRGGSGADSLVGGVGNDVLEGRGGLDTLVGGDGDDIFSYDSSAADGSSTESLLGGLDTDSVVVAGTGTQVDLSNNSLSSIEVLDMTVDDGGNTDNDDQTVKLQSSQVAGFDTIRGNAGSTAGSWDTLLLSDTMASGMLDTVTVSGQLAIDLTDLAGHALTMVNSTLLTSADQLSIDASALTGSHVLQFDGSAETQGKFSVLGGEGSDTLTGADASAGGDTLVGDGGDDVLSGLGGHDSIMAGDGNDTVTMSVANGHLDTLDGGNDSDWLVLDGTPSGTVVVDLSVAADADQMTSIGGSAEGRLQSNFEHLNAADLGTYGVYVTTTAAGSYVIGSDQNDTVIGGVETGTVASAAGLDTMVGGKGADYFSGGQGNDVIVYNNWLETGSSSVGYSDMDVIDANMLEDQLDLTALPAASLISTSDLAQGTWDGTTFTIGAGDDYVIGWEGTGSQLNYAIVKDTGAYNGLMLSLNSGVLTYQAKAPTLTEMSPVTFSTSQASSYSSLSGWMVDNFSYSTLYPYGRNAYGWFDIPWGSYLFESQVDMLSVNLVDLVNNKSNFDPYGTSGFSLSELAAFDFSVSFDSGANFVTPNASGRYARVLEQPYSFSFISDTDNHMVIDFGAMYAGGTSNVDGGWVGFFHYKQTDDTSFFFDWGWSLWHYPDSNAYSVTLVLGTSLLRNDTSEQSIVIRAGEGASAQYAGWYFGSNAANSFADADDTMPISDMMMGRGGDDTLEGGADHDTIYGGWGNDTTGSGDDVLSGGAGNDLVWGEDGSDILSGDEGDDTVIGGGGADVLDGGSGDDSLLGGAGSDTIYAGTGDDVLSGGDDADRLVFDPTELTSFDTVNGGASGSDRLVISGTESLGDANFTNISLVEILELADGNNSVTLGAEAEGAGIVSVFGGTGNDTISASAYTTNGVTFVGGAGADVLTGGAGNDVFVVDNDVASGESYNGGSGGNDELKILSDTNMGVVTTLPGIDTITLSDGVDVQFNASSLSGASLYINGTGDNANESLSVFGGTGNDLIDLSGIQVDSDDLPGLTINGGDGDDTIIGTDGVDTLIGGAGNDVFSFSSNTQTTTANTTAQMDVINDFNIAEDLIDVSDIGTSPSGLTATLAPGSDGDDYVVSWTIGGTTNYVLLNNTGTTGGLTFSNSSGVLTAVSSTSPLSFDVFTVTSTSITVSGSSPYRAYMTADATPPTYNNDSTFYTQSKNYGASNSYTFNFALLKSSSATSAEDVSSTMPHPVLGARLTIQNTNDNSINTTYPGYVYVGDNVAGSVNDNITVTDGTLKSFVYGFDGNDTLTALTADDVMFGGSGNDVIKGGAGNDVIQGGLGADDLDGEAGEDTFAFSTMDDAGSWGLGPGTVDCSNIDRIQFQTGDKLDFSAIDANPSASGDQAFTFGTFGSSIVLPVTDGTVNAFVGSYSGGVFTDDATNGTDTNNAVFVVFDNGGAAYAIVLIGVTTFGSADFIG